VARSPWLVVRRELTSWQRILLIILAFMLPLSSWCIVSYVPWIWHPLILVTQPGESDFLTEGMMIDRKTFFDENSKLTQSGRATASGNPSNPIFLPSPHKVLIALYTSFRTPPLRRGEPWLHESLLHSIRVIAWGFSIAAVLGVPLGILCGSFRAVAHLIEPVVDFIRYMPAPAFGALMVAVLGIDDGPKIAIIVIATFFTTVLVVAKTARLVEMPLLEAAQTLGASNRKLLTRVIVPAILPDLYNDLRILLGSAWTALIVAELIGASSGISYFINQQGKYRNYDRVFAGIIIIGMIGLFTDQILAFIGRFLFPWRGATNGRFATSVWTAATLPMRIRVAPLRLRKQQ
jgi:NitT/TauT family transport system permease protein